MFYGDFTCVEDVYNEFQVDPKDQLGNVIIFASYDFEGYEGYANVILIKDGKFHHVEGSHCSCFGLEGQWQPEEMPAEALIKMFSGNFYQNNEYKPLISIIEEFESVGLFKMNQKEISFYLTLKYA